MASKRATRFVGDDPQLTIERLDIVAVSILTDHHDGTLLVTGRQGTGNEVTIFEGGWDQARHDMARLASDMIAECGPVSANHVRFLIQSA